MAGGDDRRQHRDRSLESAEEARRRLDDDPRHPRDRALEDGSVPGDAADLTGVGRFLRRHDRDLARRPRD
ncbi:MAG: hypothetical protein IRZ32_07340 [Solirubrobacteraceae bacterium]|nr:hypothetical protein [Solirubrobacteraceae bacterium]